MEHRMWRRRTNVRHYRREVHMKGIWLRIATGGAAVAVMVTVMAAPAAAAVTPAKAPSVSIANPMAGDYLPRGQNWTAALPPATHPSTPTAPPGILTASA